MALTELRWPDAGGDGRLRRFPATVDHYLLGVDGLAYRSPLLLKHAVVVLRRRGDG